MAEDLKGFGQKLRELRKTAGLTQSGLALKVPIAPSLVSKWERAYTYRGRHFKPDRQTVVCLINIFADQLAWMDAQGWARQAGYTLRQPPAPRSSPPIPQESPPLPDFYVERRQIEQIIRDRLQQYPQTLVLLGPGGAGKTTLAARMAHTLADRFPDGVVWVENRPGGTVLDDQEWIARSFGLVLGGRSSAERAGELRSFLSHKRCLLVLDDAWAAPDLRHLQVVDAPGCLLVTSRDDKVPAILGAVSIQVGGLTPDEGRAMLANWAGDRLAGGAVDELVACLGGLPLALGLSGAQLQAGVTPADLLSRFRQEQSALSILDLDDPQTRAESLALCFDLSYRRLPIVIRQRFAQLSGFAGAFTLAASAALWGVTVDEARPTLRRLQRFALLETQKGQPPYRLHPLLRDYARQCLSAWPKLRDATTCRHTAWHIRYALYHPAVLDDVTDPAPDLDRTWGDVVAGVKWAAIHAPHLAARAALLAHTERAALLAEVGPDLIDALTATLSQPMSTTERAILYELQGDLYLLEQKFEAGLTCFDQAQTLWQAEENWLAASRAALRLAGTHLLRQSQAAAAAAARQAQSWLARHLPIAPGDLEIARWLFYWFDMVYNSLVRWSPLPEDDVATLASLAEQAHQPLLAARGWHIYRLWCTAGARSQQPDIQRKGRQMAIRAYRLWRDCSQPGRADDEVSWSGHLLNNRYSQRAAARFARRLSETTPRVSLPYLNLIQNEAYRWWLGATEAQRVAWLKRMLCRYLAVQNCSGKPLPPHSRAWLWVDGILNVGMLGREGRRVALVSHPSPDHILNGPEWRVLSGQKALPLAGAAAVQLVRRYLVELEQVLTT